MTYRFPVKSIRQLLEASHGADAPQVTVNGWVRTVRTQKQRAFVQVADGSNPQGIQAVVSDPEMVKGLSTGASVRLQGSLVKSIGGNQAMELKASAITLLGASDPEKYPLHKAKLPLEHLRDHFHLRSRTRTFTAMWKLRNSAMQGFHEFFQSNDFIHVNTPIFTTNDCEGAGESFRVVTPESLANQTTSTGTLKKQQQQLQQSKKDEFFDLPVNLTVSSQLHLEAMNAALPRVYTMGPAFRAEKSLSTRHLAEFWMLEAEAAFLTNLDDLLNLIEASVKATTSRVVAANADDLSVLAALPLATTGTSSHRTKEETQKLILSLSEAGPAFHRITYTEAIKILQSCGKTWTHPIDSWGASLQSEHERYLAEEFFKAPVFVTDYPASEKPFYMLDSADSEGSRGIHGGPTVACVDLLVPGIGEVAGGSLREHRLDGIQRKIQEKKMDMKGLDWYMDLRRYGAVPHGGFGLGVERYLMALSGMGNVRDVIPMPRWFGHCKY
ncbi:hypothetical protein BJ741DRAFT_310441 [Chytriomyces cf. hyalinus JEL632]|nr:hypothetical protein BJ741DRAFT_310441 [Chytriomyces cf. hyalinus JEL632]